MTRVAVLGANGFIGRSVANALTRRGADVVNLPAPRLTTRARSVVELERAIDADLVKECARSLSNLDVVVNAAGIADAVSGATDELYGANALLPAVIARAVCSQEHHVRFLHVSSAGVQGRRDCLDETAARAPFSPYTHSKALAETQLLRWPSAVIFRPTSVHGPDREVTRKLTRLLCSPVASVAGRGNAPTPQVLIENVADAISFTALTDQGPPGIVLQPWEGLTTAKLVRILGRREPGHLPVHLAQSLAAAARLLGTKSARIAGVARRLEMLWFGQQQADGWLTSKGWKPVVGLDGWERLACSE